MNALLIEDLQHFESIAANCAHVDRAVVVESEAGDGYGVGIILHGLDLGILDECVDDA